MSELEKKTKEISEKWKAKIQEQGIGDIYKFYRKNQIEFFEDFEELWFLWKIEALKQIQ
jgi:hypothetical protein